MKRTIGLLLATAGLALLVAGCAEQGGGSASSPGAGASAGGSQTAAVNTNDIRDFNLRVKCPGVHELKAHGWSDQQIMQQLSVAQEDIPACEHWSQQQQRGYTPPPPAGVSAAAKPAPSAGASPSAAQ